MWLRRGVERRWCLSETDQRHPFSGPDFGGSTTAMMRTPLTDAQISAAARCPRCGYDMNGELAGWAKQGACAVESTCPECGFRISWRFLLNPAFIERIQSFELTKQRIFQAWLRTCLKVLWPPALWREIRLELPVGLVRIGWGVLAEIGVSQLVFAFLIQIVWRINVPSWYRRYWFELRSNEILLEACSLLLPAPWTRPFPVWEWVLDWLGIGLLAILVPGCFMLAPSTLRRCSIRPEAFVRVIGYLPVTVYVWVGVCGTIVFLEGIVHRKLFGESQPRWLIAITPVSALVVIWMWWAIACRDYLKLPRPWLIATAFMLIAMGIVLLIAVLTGQAVPFAYRWLA